MKTPNRTYAPMTCLLCGGMNHGLRLDYNWDSPIDFLFDSSEALRTVKLLAIDLLL